MTSTPRNDRSTFDYQRYLASREWAVLKQKVRLRAALGVEAWMETAYCERCRAHLMYAAHHLTYERIGREELDDLLGVCKGCHEFLSGKTESDPVDDALMTQAQELGRDAAELVALGRGGDWNRDDTIGWWSCAMGALDEIHLLDSRRRAIAAGAPASAFLRPH